MRKCQKRPIIWYKRPIRRTKETYKYTDLPEVCACVKRDLSIGKRGLFIWQKRPTNTSIPDGWNATECASSLKYLDNSRVLSE